MKDFHFGSQFHFIRLGGMDRFIPEGLVSYGVTLDESQFHYFARGEQGFDSYEEVEV